MNPVDNILGWLREQAEKKAPIDPIQFLEAAAKLEAMYGDETDRLIQLEHQVAVLRSTLLTQHGAAAKARVHVEASEDYSEMRRQKARCDHIQEMIRIAKLWARLKNEQLRSGL